MKATAGRLPSLPRWPSRHPESYADDAAAATGDMSATDIYCTGSIVK